MLRDKKGIRLLFAPDDEGGAPSLDGFDEEEPEETEIITLGPGEKPPEEEPDGDGGDDGKVSLSREEYEALKNGKDPTAVLAEGLEGLKEVLGKQGQAANVQQQPGESDEDFEKRLERDLFSEGKSGKAIKEAIERYGSGTTAQLMGYISAQNKQLLQLDEAKGSVFRKYKDEIEKFVENLPANQRNHPQVWDYAYEQVKGRHVDDIAREQADSRIDELVNERLKELGVDPETMEKQGARKKAASGHVESGRGSANASSNGSRKKRTLYATADDKDRARKSGVSLEVYMKRKRG